MDLTKALDLVSVLSMLAAGVSGFIIGYLVISLTPTAKFSANLVLYMLTFVGAVFFFPIILDRYVEHVNNWERTISTWVLFQIYIYSRFVCRYRY